MKYYTQDDTNYNRSGTIKFHSPLFRFPPIYHRRCAEPKEIRQIVDRFLRVKPFLH